MAKRPFSRRNQIQSDTFTYDISSDVRLRIFHTLQALPQRFETSLESMFLDAMGRALKQYGKLDGRQHGNTHREIALAHFMDCEHSKAIDFLEWAFQSDSYRAQQFGVDEVNAILREEGVGYEFSHYVVTRVGRGTNGQGFETFSYDIQYPEATIKNNEVAHSSMVMPALELLASKVWFGANTEMLKAHDHLRLGNFADAIDWAGKCLESVLQIICDNKRWPFIPDKDTLNPLLQACYKGKLFDAPYIEIIQKSSGELRNKYGGHGKAKSANGQANFNMAQHMIQITSAHVILLAKLSKL